MYDSNALPMTPADTQGPQIKRQLKWYTFKLWRWDNEFKCSTLRESDDNRLALHWLLCWCIATFSYHPPLEFLLDPSTVVVVIIQVHATTHQSNQHLQTTNNCLFDAATCATLLIPPPQTNTHRQIETMFPVAPPYDSSNHVAPSYQLETTILLYNWHTSDPPLSTTGYYGTHKYHRQLHRLWYSYWIISNWAPIIYITGTLRSSNIPHY